MSATVLLLVINYDTTRRTEKHRLPSSMPVLIGSGWRAQECAGPGATDSPPECTTSALRGSPIGDTFIVHDKYVTKYSGPTN